MQATSRSTFSRAFISLLLAYAFMIPLLAPLLFFFDVTATTEKAGNSKEFSPRLSMKRATQEPEWRSGELLLRFRAGVVQQTKKLSWRRTARVLRNNCVARLVLRRSR